MAVRPRSFDNQMATSGLSTPSRRSERMVGYSYLGVSGITPSPCYPEYRALSQKSAIEAINSKVGRVSVQNHAPQP